MLNSLTFFGFSNLLKSVNLEVKVELIAGEST